MRIALIGFGRWGRHHARVLANHGHLEAVVDPDPVQLDQCRQLYPSTVVCTSFEKLHWDSIDGVVVASPIEHHFPQALTALANGKHCLVEKPLALDLSDVEQLMKLAQDAGCVLLTGHILDYHPAARELVRTCQNGQLGRLRYWHSARSRLVPPRRYVSVIHELLWHDLSLLLRVVGRMPESAQTMGGLDQDGLLALDFGDFYATLRGSQVQSLRESAVLVVGDNGTLLFDDERISGRKLQYQRHDASVENISITSIEPLAAEIEHFVKAANGEEAPISGAEQAMQILEIIEMAQNSCATCSQP